MKWPGGLPWRWPLVGPAGDPSGRGTNLAGVRWGVAIPGLQQQQAISILGMSPFIMIFPCSFLILTVRSSGTGVERNPWGCVCFVHVEFRAEEGELTIGRGPVGKDGVSPT